MLSFDEVRDILDDIANQLPQEIFRELNGGVILVPEAKKHELSQDLYIMGQYHWHPNGLGRYITIYYGSFAHAYGNVPRERLVEKLREVLHHELTHHLEYLAGDRSLVIQDQENLRRYMDKRK